MPIEAAIELHRRECPVKVVLFNIGGNLLTADTVSARDRFIAEVGRNDLEEVINRGPDASEMPSMSASTLVIDGIFGSEHRKPLRGGYQAVARGINESGAMVVSIDLPSGIQRQRSCRWHGESQHHPCRCDFDAHRPDSRFLLCLKMPNS